MEFDGGYRWGWAGCGWVVWAVMRGTCDSKCFGTQWGKVACGSWVLEASLALNAEIMASKEALTMAISGAISDRHDD